MKGEIGRTDLTNDVLLYPGERRMKIDGWPKERREEMCGNENRAGGEE